MRDEARVDRDDAMRPVPMEPGASVGDGGVERGPERGGGELDGRAQRHVAVARPGERLGDEVALGGPLRREVEMLPLARAAPAGGPPDTAARPGRATPRGSRRSARARRRAGGRGPRPAAAHRGSRRGPRRRHPRARGRRPRRAGPARVASPRAAHHGPVAPPSWIPHPRGPVPSADPIGWGGRAYRRRPAGPLTCPFAPWGRMREKSGPGCPPGVLPFVVWVSAGAAGRTERSHP